MRTVLLIYLACAVCLAAHAAPPANGWTYWAENDMNSTERVDHAAWQNFLDRYLVTTKDGRTLVRYRAVSTRDQAALQGYIDELTALDPRTLDRDEQFAYWINLYNALTVNVVLRNPGKPGIKRMGKGLLSTGPWNDELALIAGKPVTLNDIEHRILRPFWKDHRIHYAVNCASISCPNLAPEVYTRENLERLLDSGEQAYLQDPRGLLFLPDGTLQLSSILDWYRQDFAADQAGLLRYLAGVRVDLADRLSSYSGKIRFDYDWSLNDAE